MFSCRISEVPEIVHVVCVHACVHIILDVLPKRIHRGKRKLELFMWPVP
jgi:hypothetical protein